MPDHSLTAAERKRLLALMLVTREVTNRELREQTGVILEKDVRVALEKLGLVDVRQPGRALVHELTDAGWARCKVELSAPLAERGDKFTHALLVQLESYLARSDLQLADFFASSPDRKGPADEVIAVDARIRAAYGALAPGPDAWLRLTRLRAHLNDVVKEDLDAALRRLHRTADVVIVPDSDQRRLTPEDRSAAVRIGGEERHLLKVTGS